MDILSYRTKKKISDSVTKSPICIVTIRIVLLPQLLFTIIEDTRTGQTISQNLLQIMQTIKIIGTKSFPRLDFIGTYTAV